MVRNISIFISVVFLLAVAVLAAAFFVRNSAPVELDYYLGTSVGSLSLFMVCAFAVGVVVGLAGGLTVAMRVKAKSMRMKRDLKSSERELNQLRFTAENK